MTENGDNTLRDTVRRAWPNVEAAAFDAAWRAARQRHAAGRRRYRRFAGAAAAVAVLVVAFNVRAPAGHGYVELADLLESTYWSAPSDVLLPQRNFDLYQDLPVIFESTEPAEGALL